MGKGHRAKSCTRCGGPALFWLRQLGVALGSSETMCLFPGTFSVALMLSSLLFSITPRPSQLPANQVPTSSQWLRTLHPSWPTQGQKARSSGTLPPLTSRPLRGQGNPRLSAGLVPSSSPGTDARAKVVGIMASRAEPKTEERLGWQKGAGPDGPAPTAGLLHSHPPGQSCSHLPCAPVATAPTHHRAFENKGEVPPQQELVRGWSGTPAIRDPGDCLPAWPLPFSKWDPPRKKHLGVLEGRKPKTHPNRVCLVGGHTQEAPSSPPPSQQASTSHPFP